MKEIPDNVLGEFRDEYRKFNTAKLEAIRKNYKNDIELWKRLSEDEFQSLIYIEVVTRLPGVKSEDLENREEIYKRGFANTNNARSRIEELVEIIDEILSERWQLANVSCTILGSRDMETMDAITGELMGEQV